MYLYVCIHILKSLYTYVYIYIYMYVFIYVYIHIYVYIYMCIHMYICKSILYTYTYVYIHIYTYIHMYMYYICVCAYVYICISIFVYQYVYICICSFIYICIFINLYVHSYIDILIEIYTYIIVHIHTCVSHTCVGKREETRDRETVSLVHVCECDVPRSHKWRDLFMRVAWLTHMFHLTHSCVWHDWTHSCVWYDITHSCVWHVVDSTIRFTWLICVCAVTHPYVSVWYRTRSPVWHYSFMTWKWAHLYESHYHLYKFALSFVWIRIIVSDQFHALLFSLKYYGLFDPMTHTFLDICIYQNTHGSNGTICVHKTQILFVIRPIHMCDIHSNVWHVPCICVWWQGWNQTHPRYSTRRHLGNCSQKSAW